MTAGDRTSFIAGGGKLTATHEQMADWRWKMRKLTQAGFQNIAATNGAVTHDNDYQYTTYNTDATADIVLTVPDGTVPGERQTIKLITDGGNDVVITPTSLKDGSTVTLATTLHVCVLFWDGSNWNVESTDDTVA